ncbi:uncharacterized protein [Antedon mediterranea]|uniref:uncharacterized protein n=1 Tax=Antedon mediterranea TaxID=105859 RepID=UPI003AF60AF7
MVVEAEIKEHNRADNNNDENNDDNSNSSSKGSSTDESDSIATEEVEGISNLENTSQEILQVVGLQQTINILVLFLKAGFTDGSWVIIATHVTIYLCIVAEIFLACVVATKVWLRKTEQDRVSRLLKQNPLSHKINTSSKLLRRLKTLDLLSFILVLFIGILTTILLGMSGLTTTNNHITMPDGVGANVTA